MKRKRMVLCTAFIIVAMMAGAVPPGKALAGDQLELPLGMNYLATAESGMEDTDAARVWLENALDLYQASVVAYEVNDIESLTEENIPDKVEEAEKEVAAKGNTALLAEFEGMRARARLVRMRFSVVPVAGREDMFREWGARQDGERLAFEWIMSLNAWEGERQGTGNYCMGSPFRVMDPLMKRDADAARWLEEVKAGKAVSARDLSPDYLFATEHVAETPKGAGVAETARVWAVSMMELYVQAGVAEAYTVETEDIPPPSRPQGYDEWMKKAEEEGMKRFAHQLEQLANPQAHAKVTVSVKPSAGKAGVFADWGRADGDGVITGEWAARRRSYLFPFYYENYEDENMAYSIITHIPYEEYMDQLDGMEDLDVASMYVNRPEIDPPQAGPYQYRIEGGRLSVTYDGGANWAEVPISAEHYREYGGKDGMVHYEVIQDGGYLITPEKTMFVYGFGWYESMAVQDQPVVRCVYSDDMGKTWEDSAVSLTGGPFVWECSFDGEEGTIALSLDRRGHEMKRYHTSNGGETWSPVRNMVSFGEKYISDDIGFMLGDRQGAYLYRTDDGGRNWFAAEYGPTGLAEEDMAKFYWPGYPAMENGVLIWDIYEGGKDAEDVAEAEKLRFTSGDGGATFQFAERTDAAQTEYDALPWYI